ncbi:MAG TPA: L-seryl-tRNA(Sec) selenium transferase [Vicinamibacterales bacterium]|nr:L-seryl-tRNA(Sec) selenium transferase [Vicinamibacterales bacterium]
MPSLRLIPSIDTLVARPSLAREATLHGHESVTRAARLAADELRATLKHPDANGPASEDDAIAWLERRIREILAARLAPSLRPVVNATGVIIHTNLGRAPLAAEAIHRTSRIAAGYSNLEYDLEAGDRGHRHAHAERLLLDLTGGEAALVANNNAAATLLVLAALAGGREVLVSRGELVEIGGGFRVPDVLAQSGAVLREVGTTNRTRVADYAAAISDRTALLLRVHPSNFRIEGFTERPALGALADLAHRFSLPLFEDLGSGWLGTAEGIASLRDEPPVVASLKAGADLVAFSGDKLLGGPQAGIVVGRRDLIDRVRRHPLMRAVRADKLTYAALEATLALWADAPARVQIPVFRMLALSVEEIETRARRVLDRISGVPSLRAEIIDGASTAGGGSAPGSALPTKLIALAVDGVSAAALDARLRAGDPPIVGRIQNDRVVLDLRTVSDAEEPDLLAGIRRAVQS